MRTNEKAPGSTLKSRVPETPHPGRPTDRAAIALPLTLPARVVVRHARSWLFAGLGRQGRVLLSAADEPFHQRLSGRSCSGSTRDWPLHLRSSIVFFILMSFLFHFSKLCFNGFQCNKINHQKVITTNQVVNLAARALCVRSSGTHLHTALG